MNWRLEMSDIHKRFGATQALRSVSLKVAPGEIHALIGENGAGKSTLMKILSGACRPDSGTILLDGVPYEGANPAHARRCGVGMIYQELTLAPDLSVEENILLGEEPRRFGFIQTRERRRRAEEALASLGHGHLDPARPIRHCTIAEQQVVEIARALIGQSRVLIMDEPTSSLTRVDTENLFRLMAGLKAQGVSLIYISHFLEECRQVADRYTVLRDGETVGTGEMKDSRLSEIIRLIVGREVREIYPRSPREKGRTALALRSLSGKKRPVEASLDLAEGEILGIAGLIGSGRTETLRTAFGLDRMPRGDVLVFENRIARPSPKRLWREGAGLLSENRKEEGLMVSRSVAENLTATDMTRFSRAGWISRKIQNRVTGEWIDRLRIKSRSPEQAVGELSGGNQQKVALARLLHHPCRILLLDEPTRGIDVGSKSEIYQLLNDLAAAGKAILFVSSYLPELLGVCDRIAVMCRGVLGPARPVSEWTEHSIMAAAIGRGAE